MRDVRTQTPLPSRSYSEAMAQRVLELEASLRSAKAMLRRRDQRIESLRQPRSLHCVSCNQRRAT